MNAPQWEDAAHEVARLLGVDRERVTLEGSGSATRLCLDERAVKQATHRLRAAWPVHEPVPPAR